MRPNSRLRPSRRQSRRTRRLRRAPRAAIEAAQLNVDYTALRSPIDGVTGIRHIDIGNLVQANSGQNLVTITQIEPIYVIFTLPEADIDRVRRAMANGKLNVQAYAPDDQRKISEGELKLIDNTVNQTTGTVQLKAEFVNADRGLWPGQFVNAHVVLRTIQKRGDNPISAVQIGPQDQTAPPRPRCGLGTSQPEICEGKQGHVSRGYKSSRSRHELKPRPRADDVGDVEAGEAPALQQAAATASTAARSRRAAAPRRCRSSFAGGPVQAEPVPIAP